METVYSEPQEEKEVRSYHPFTVGTARSHEYCHSRACIVQLSTFLFGHKPQQPIYDLQYCKIDCLVPPMLYVFIIYFGIVRQHTDTPNKQKKSVNTHLLTCFAERRVVQLFTQLHTRQGLDGNGLRVTVYAQYAPYDQYVQYARYERIMSRMDSKARKVVRRGQNLSW